MSEAERYDAIIIGTGQAAKPLASALADAGWHVAVIERSYVGGSCINYGCTPSKTMYASAMVAHLARRGSDYGVQTGGVWVDMGDVYARKEAVVQQYRVANRRQLVKHPQIDLIDGEGHFVDGRTVEVRLNAGGTRRVTAERIIIDTGMRPRMPDLAGLEGAGTLDSTTVMELQELPAHLLILGGGYVGVEFGQMFRRFGSEVTIVQRNEQLLPREDPDVAEEIQRIFAEEGIDVLLQSQAREVRRRPDGMIELRVATPAGETTLVGSHLLVAVGQTPNTDALNLPAAGVEVDERGYVRTNDRLESSVSGIYAAGDVKGGPAFTHISYDDYRVLEANLLGKGEASIAGRQLPYAVFIDPQLGRVGLTERDARAAGHKVLVGKMPMRHVARAIEADQMLGLMKAVVDADTDQILGCAILGMEGAEVMALVQVAMLGRLPYQRLRDAIFVHPTLAEALNNLFFRLE